MQLFIPALIGLVAGTLGGLLGIGGSLIIIPAMVIYLSHTASGYHGIDQHLLQASAMIVNVFVAAPSVIPHYRAGAIMRPIVAWLIPTSIVGIISGVALSNSSAFARENGAYLALIFCGFLAYVIGYNLHRMLRQAAPSGDAEPSQAARWKIVVVGLVMGLLAGLLGIGGGAICVPMQQVLLKIPLRKAIANSATTIPFASMIGAVHKNLTLSNHGFEISQSLLLAAMLIPTAILGSYFGGRLTHVLPRRILRAAFVFFLGAVTILTFSKALKALTPPPPQAASLLPRLTCTPGDLSFHSGGAPSASRRSMPKGRVRARAPRQIDEPVCTAAGDRDLAGSLVAVRANENSP